jgi:hypothetical protein
MTTTYTYDDRIVSDLHKDTYGFRPCSGWWTEWKASDEAGKQAIWDMLLESLDETIAYEKRQHEAAIEAFEARVDQLVGLGAVNRLMAIRWIVDSLELTENDLCYGPDYVCYCLGLPYSLSSLFTETVAELTKKEAA